nr:trypsin-like peptidase domain-containing protein [Marivita sp.]
MRRILGKLTAFIVGAAAAGIVAWLVLDTPTPIPDPREVTPRGALAPQEETIIALFERAQESVVSITTEERVVDPWARRAIDVPRGTGSGFVWDEAGHVVTNHHVITGASGARLRLADGRVLQATLVGSAPEHDLAVLRIETGRDRPTPLPIGESGTLQVGQSVLAIGNPFGLDWTLTTGIVSALDREIPARGGGLVEGLIQTDAAINPGNSGGPLIDSAGRLIGVNTAIFSPSGASAGIGFAVPVDTVSRVVPRLIQAGRYSPPYLGVRHSDRISALASARGLKGVPVLGVEPGSPAAAVDLRPAGEDAAGQLVLRDIIVALGGQSVSSRAELEAALAAQTPNEPVTLRIWREGETIDLSVVLADPDP